MGRVGKFLVCKKFFSQSLKCIHKSDIVDSVKGGVGKIVPPIASSFYAILSIYEFFSIS